MPELFIPRSTGPHEYLQEDAPVHNEWPESLDFTTNLEAALFWALAGFPVAPDGAGDFTTDPQAITAAWRSAPDAEVLAQPPAGTFGLYSIPGKVRDLAKGTELLCDGAPLRWDAFRPHWRDDYTQPPVVDTFVLRYLGGQVSDPAMEVRLYRSAGVTPAAHHFPEGIQLLSSAMPMPCPTNDRSGIQARGLFQSPPPHLLAMMQPEALPCSEQDLKGYPCRVCRTYSNARSVDHLAAAAAEYAEMEPQGLDVFHRAELLGWREEA